MLTIFKTTIDGYEEYYTPTESTKDGSALYINKSIESKPCKDLEKKLYISKKLESSFAEILIKGQKNIIVCCIYKHHPLDVDEFNIIFEHAMETIIKKFFCLVILM